MFNLRWLACSLIFTSFAVVSDTADAQDYWNVRRNPNCGQSNGYPTSGMPSHRSSLRSYGDYPTYDSRGYLPNRGDMQAHSQQRHFQEQTLYNRSTPSPYRYDNRQMTWQGSSLYGYPGRNSDTVYDSLHGDYHAVPRAQSYPTSTGHSHGHSSEMYREQFSGHSGW